MAATITAASGPTTAATTTSATASSSSRRLEITGPAAAGLGMMGLGVLITVLGLAVGFLVFIGPWLFIVGVVALVKGIAAGKM
jgi:hypothetical protein